VSLGHTAIPACSPAADQLLDSSTTKAGAVASGHGFNQLAPQYTARSVCLQAMGWMASVVRIAGAIDLDGAFMAGAKRTVCGRSALL
jgi:hypothetical protein